uniref:Uncharacterized protein n=1 Tax=Oryza barthii TaxID=65489 RepID=A0A0D3FT21_9ORYZ
MLRRSKKQKLAKEDEDARSSDTEPPSVYLVVGHGVTRPSYSVFKVNPHLPANADDGGDTPLPLPPYLAHLTGKHCMSFVPVRSRRHAPWIVGVGGSSARNCGPDETIVFDTEMRKEILGPNLLSTKLCPILLPFGDKIYNLARRPVVTGDDLTPTDYIFPPVVTIKSHVAVASYILLSITGQSGTHMFDVETEEWRKLDDNDLPFHGRAVPLQGTGTLYLGLSNTSNEITAHRIKVVSAASAVASPSITPAGCLSLSIVEIRMVTNFEEDEEIIYFPLTSLTDLASIHLHGPTMTPSNSHLYLSTRRSFSPLEHTQQRDPCEFVMHREVRVARELQKLEKKVGTWEAAILRFCQFKQLAFRTDKNKLEILDFMVINLSYCWFNMC